MSPAAEWMWKPQKIRAELEKSELKHYQAGFRADCGAVFKADSSQYGSD